MIATVPKLMNIISEIDSIRKQTDEVGSKLIKLGKEAIVILDQLLDDKPEDFQLRMLRIKLNSDWLFSNYNNVVEDAQFIIDYPGFTLEKLEGYKCLIDVYNHHFNLPKKEIAILENKLIDVHTIFDDSHELYLEKASTLYQLAKAYHKSGNVDYAYELLETSNSIYPYYHQVNQFLGVWYLEQENFDKAQKYLWAHFLWGEHKHEKDMIVYGKNLLEFFLAQKLSNNPDLIALLFHIIRNFKEGFGCFLNKDFFKKYGDILIREVNKYPTNSKLVVVLANTYYLDLKDYNKAYIYYKQYLEGDAPHFQSYIPRVFESAYMTNQPFFELPIYVPNHYKNENLISYYYLALDFFELYEIKFDSKFLKLAQQYIAIVYEQMRKFLFHGIGDPYCNLPMFFDLTCVLYGKILRKQGLLHTNQKQKNKLFKQAAQVHWDGFICCNYQDNLELAIKNASNSNDHELCIYYANYIFKDFENFNADVQTFKNIYFLNYSFLKLEDLKKVKSIYLIAKYVYVKNKVINQDVTEVFLNLGYEYFTMCMAKEEDLDFILPEMEWITSLKEVKKVHQDIYGAILYFIGFCLEKKSKVAEARFSYKNALDFLKDQQDEYFVKLYSQALIAYNTM